jgi:hypothetical protein
MMIRLPSTTAVLPPTDTIAGFVVTYRTSQFTATSLRATEEAIVTATREDGYRSTFGFFYDASVDRIQVCGEFSDRMLKSLDRLTGLDVQETEGVGRMRGIESRT